MNKLRNLASAGAALGLGVLLVMAAMAYQRAGQPLPLESLQLTAQIAVAGQLSPAQLADLKARGFATIIASPAATSTMQPVTRPLRKAPSGQVGKDARAPLPRGDIVPPAAVIALVQALATHPEPEPDAIADDDSCG